MPSHPWRLQNGWPNTCCCRIWKSTKSTKKKTKKLKTHIRQIFAPEGGRPLRGRPPFGASMRRMLFCRLLGFLHDFVNSHILPQHMLAIHLAISKHGLALSKKIRKTWQPSNLANSGRQPVCRLPCLHDPFSFSRMWGTEITQDQKTHKSKKHPCWNHGCPCWVPRP